MIEIPYADILTADHQALITTIPNLSTKGGWRLAALHARPAYSFAWITRGQGHMTVGGTARGLTLNSVIYIPAGMVHALSFSQGAQGYFAALPDNLPLAMPAHPALIKATSVFDQSQITSYFEQIATEARNAGPGSEQVIESYATLLGVWIERNQHRNDWMDGRASGKAAALVEKFLNRLEVGFHRSHRVEDYAQDLGITSTHLTRLCQERLGKPASGLIQERALHEAKRCLRGSPVAVAEIAKGLGYSSPAYFTRAFQNATGLSPRAFRKAGDAALFRRARRLPPSGQRR